MMKVHRIIYGNAAADSGQGWRVLKRPKSLKAKDEQWLREACGAAYESAQAHSRDRIFFAQSRHRSLLLGYGSLQGRDAYGRPGGWLFFVCICRPYAYPVATAIPLTRSLFDGCRNWLETEELSDSRFDHDSVDVMLHNTQQTAADFWRDLSPLASLMQTKLMQKKGRAKSYIFPAATPVPGFDIAIGEADMKTPVAESHRLTGWQRRILLMLVLAVLALGGTSFYFGQKHRDLAAIVRTLKTRVEELTAENQGLTERNRSLQKDVEEQIAEVRRLRSENNRLSIRVTALEQNASDELVRQRDEMREELEANKRQAQQLRESLAPLMQQLKKQSEASARTHNELENVRDACNAVITNKIENELIDR